jgi:hypothetical protein
MQCGNSAFEKAKRRLFMQPSKAGKKNQTYTRGKMPSFSLVRRACRLVFSVSLVTQLPPSSDDEAWPAWHGAVGK